MAIDAIDLDCVARFSVKLAVAVAVLLEVAVNAVHPFFEMNVFEVHGLPKFVGIVERDRLVVFIEQVALAIVLEDRAEDPSMTVEVAELGVLQLLVEFRRAGFSRNLTSDQRPRMAERSGLRVWISMLLARAGIALLGGHMCSPSISLSHQVYAEIGRDHVRAGVHVADHALAGRESSA